MIDRTEAARLALDYLERDSRGYTFKLVRTNEHPDDWAIVFEVMAPSGYALDGPIVLLVDFESGVVRTLSEAIAAGWRGDAKL